MAYRYDKNIEIVDNFLDQEYFDSLVTLCTAEDQGFMWDMRQNIVSDFDFPTADTVKLFALVHFFYKSQLENTQTKKRVQGIGHPCSPHFEKIIPMLAKLPIKSLLRVKANLYPNSGETLHEHEMHIDYRFKHLAAMLSLNTCDGYTLLEDGTKVESVANRMLFFDASQMHCSTTTTSKFGRVNIIMNYIFWDGM